MANGKTFIEAINEVIEKLNNEDSTIIDNNPITVYDSNKKLIFQLNEKIKFNSSISITSYNYSYYLNKLPESRNEYISMILSILYKIFTDYDNYKDYFNEAFKNIILIHNNLKSLKYDINIIRMYQNIIIDKVNGNSASKFKEEFEKITNKKIKNFINYKIEKYIVDITSDPSITLNNIYTSNKKFNIFTLLIMYYLHPERFIIEIIENFKENISNQQLLANFVAFFQNIKDIDTVYEKLYENFERLHKDKTISSIIDAANIDKTLFYNEDIINAFKYVKEFLDNKNVDDFDINELKFEKPEYKYLIINKDSDIINLFKENPILEEKFNIYNNGLKLEELDNNYIYFNDKYYELKFLIDNDNKFIADLTSIDDHTDFKNSKLLIYTLLDDSTINDDIKDKLKKRPEELIENSIENIKSKKASEDIVSLSTEPNCTDVKLKYYLESCYIDSLFVALFNQKHKAMNNILYDMTINEEYNKIYYYALMIKKELISLYEKISNKQINSEIIMDKAFRKYLEECKKIIIDSNIADPSLKNEILLLQDINESSGNPNILLQLLGIIFKFPKTYYNKLGEEKDFILNTISDFEAHMGTIAAAVGSTSPISYDITNYIDSIILPNSKINTSLYISIPDGADDINKLKIYKKIYNLTLNSIIVYLKGSKHYVCVYNCDNKWFLYNNHFKIDNDFKVKIDEITDNVDFNTEILTIDKFKTITEKIFVHSDFTTTSRDILISGLYYI